MVLRDASASKKLSFGITSVLREGPAGPQESLPWHRKQPMDIFCKWYKIQKLKCTWSVDHINWSCAHFTIHNITPTLVKFVVDNNNHLSSVICVHSGTLWSCSHSEWSLIRSLAPQCHNQRGTLQWQPRRWARKQQLVDHHSRWYWPFCKREGKLCHNSVAS